MSSPEDELVLEPYLSLPLSTTTDCTRLVRVHPDLSDDGLLSCELETVAFAQRPRYDALSYRWGDESNKKRILLNGFPMLVTANLWAALDYLRTHRRQLPIWVDALSINQAHVAEHSRQLRIMPHIYTRATTVVVWLGTDVAQLVDATPDHRDDDGIGGGANQAALELILANAYWGRVWIIQEIGKARRIELLIGHEPWAWETFIAWIESDAQTGKLDYETGPLRLERLRKEKYSGGNTLRQLLENHTAAQCKNPKDKIYGLVGLASDSRGFPLDYGRSMLDVWSDTIRFMSRNSLLPQEHGPRMDFCAHIRTLLGGDKLESVGGLVQFANPEGAVSSSAGDDDGDEIAQSALRFATSCYGVITSLGPSASELLADLQLADQWAAELQKVHAGDLDAAHAENDALTEYLLETEPQDTAFAQVHTWPNHRLDYKGNGLYDNYWHWRASNGKAPNLQGKWNYATTTPDEARLALVTVSEDGHRKTACKIALVPPLTAQGDLICRIDGYPMKRVVVRHERWSKYSAVPRAYVVGTAIMAADLATKIGYQRDLRDSYQVTVDLDASTLYCLLFGGTT